MKRFCFLLSLFFMPLSASATLITFEEVEPASGESISITSIGEVGFSELVILSLDDASSPLIDNIDRWTNSPNNAASLSHSTTYSFFMLDGSDFDLNSFYIAKSHGSTINPGVVKGFNNGAELYSANICGNLNCWIPVDGSPEKQVLNWVDVDQVTINWGFYTSGFVFLDDIEYQKVTAVPLPSSMILLVSGLFWMRRKLIA